MNESMQKPRAPLALRVLKALTLACYPAALFVLYVYAPQLPSAVAVKLCAGAVAVGFLGLAWLAADWARHDRE